MKPVLGTGGSGLVAIPSRVGTGFWSVCLWQIRCCVCQNVMRDMHKLGSELDVLVMEPAHLRADTSPGLNHKLSLRFNPRALPDPSEAWMIGSETS